jgi:REP element-mobilizing transposase RayT
MPRKARIDAPGALQHIIARGIERRKIFFDDTDRDDFLTRLGGVLADTRTDFYAWALIPNHFHHLSADWKASNLLIETVDQGEVPGANSMVV